jgi:hypothetical protein
LYNYFSIETDVAYRQFERERNLVAAERGALASRMNRGKTWRHVASVIAALPRMLAAHRVQFLARGRTGQQTRALKATNPV